MKEVCDRLGVRKTRTTPLHPQSDGLVERFNRTLTTQLSVLTSRHQRDWDRHVPLVLWACRSAVQESTGCTPALLMFGRELRTPVDLAFGSPPEPEVGGEVGPEYLRQLRRRLESAHAFARRHLTEAGGRQKRAYDTQCHGCPLAPGDWVWVYNPRRKRGLCPKLTDSWVGPCVILGRLLDVVYRVRMGPGRRPVVLHRDRLAPYHPKEPAPGPPGESPPGPAGSPSPHRPRRVRRLPLHLRDFVLSGSTVAGTGK
uniref:Integrase catalytic domain-containing protein n=1 Tax=Scleropages formosus TaxID=113540 RepID=A0A8C9SS53_SCLFO